MDKIIFFAPEILQTKELPHEEALHCIKVLRKKEGDEILITDGKGFFYEATIVHAHQKHCMVEIINTIETPNNWRFNLQLAFAPTKNTDRSEWFVEKATEIGINRISPILCRHSERKDIKPQRFEKILVSAIKQSQKATLPIFDELIDFEAFIKQPFDGSKYIAHCYDSIPKIHLKDIYKKNDNALILIGPEGDFSEEEVEKAIKEGFQSISLGNSRLRTETAALFACNTIHILN